MTSCLPSLLAVLLCLLGASAAQNKVSRRSLTSEDGFVYAQGINLMLNGRKFYFAGTNAFYAGSTDVTSDDQIRQLFKIQSSNGAKVVRTWAYVNGFGGGSVSSTSHPIQPSIGEYSEEGMKRIDLILSEARKQDMKVILTLGNYEDQFGGIQWYVDQLLGSGHDKEEFYTNSQAKDAYRNYVSHVVYRTNSINGIQYKEDTTILSWELLNEPHTRDLYEKNRGMPAGQLVKNWLREMSAWLKDLDSNHLISSGEEGYRAGGPTETQGSVGANSWINGGYKGVDFVGNIHLPHIDFATIHCYPDNWAIPASEYEWVRTNFIADRANIAHAAGKPIIMEESGMKTGYVSSRSSYLANIYEWANENDYAGTLVWQVYAWDFNDGQYDFNYQMDGAQALWNQYSHMNGKSG